MDFQECYDILKKRSIEGHLQHQAKKKLEVAAEATAGINSEEKTVADEELLNDIEQTEHQWNNEIDINLNNAEHESTDDPSVMSHDSSNVNRIDVDLSKYDDSMREMYETRLEIEQDENVSNALRLKYCVHLMTDTIAWQHKRVKEYSNFNSRLHKIIEEYVNISRVTSSIAGPINASAITDDVKFIQEEFPKFCQDMSNSFSYISKFILNIQSKLKSLNSSKNVEGTCDSKCPEALLVVNIITKIQHFEREKFTLFAAKCLDELRVSNSTMYDCFMKPPRDTNSSLSSSTTMIEPRVSLEHCNKQIQSIEVMVNELMDEIQCEKNNLILME